MDWLYRKTAFEGETISGYFGTALERKMEFLGQKISSGFSLETFESKALHFAD